MDINQIKKLIRVVENSEITEFSIQEGDLKIKISKNSKDNISYQMPVPTPPVQQNEPPEQSPKKVEVTEAETKDVSNPNHYEVRSPIVGTFYRAPAPDADPYVQVGDSVTSGSVLCIVEAMKLLNEIESDVDGKIVKILIDNATPVEYNQPIFLIEKS